MEEEGTASPPLVPGVFPALGGWLWKRGAHVPKPGTPGPATGRPAIEEGVQLPWLGSPGRGVASITTFLSNVLCSKHRFWGIYIFVILH